MNWNVAMILGSLFTNEAENSPWMCFRKKKVLQLSVIVP